MPLNDADLAQVLSGLWDRMMWLQDALATAERPHPSEWEVELARCHRLYDSLRLRDGVLVVEEPEGT